MRKATMMKEKRRGVAAVCLALAAVLALPAVALAADTQPMYRLYNPNGGEHFYTASAGEKANLVGLGWNDEGVGWTAPVESNTPVHRLYNPNNGDHHYTRSVGERDLLTGQGWNYEGVGWYSDDAEGVALFRLYNPNATTGSHSYTTSSGERDLLVAQGWHAEGVGWYGVAGASDQAQGIKPQEYTVDYFWQGKIEETDSIKRSVTRCLPGDGIPNGALIGLSAGDYNGDGSKEQLAVRWLDGNVVLEVCRETSGGLSVIAQTAVVDENGAWPLGLRGTFDILTNDEDQIIAQWATSSSGVGDGMFWTIVRYQFTGGSLVELGRVDLNGSNLMSLVGFKQQLRELGITDANVPDDNPTFNWNNFADIEPSYTIVCRMNATSELLSNSQLYKNLYALGSDWSAPYHSGTVTFKQSK